jgi:integrase
VNRPTGFVLASLSPNKYSDRSNAIGKRFGRLARKEGFGAPYVFHSIRKTVATLLKNAGFPENIAADIIGHDKPTMTYR